MHSEVFMELRLEAPRSDSQQSHKDFRRLDDLTLLARKLYPMLPTCSERGVGV
jgi:hypothetical protein